MNKLQNLFFDYFKSWNGQDLNYFDKYAKECIENLTNTFGLEHKQYFTNIIGKFVDTLKLLN